MEETYIIILIIAILILILYFVNFHEDTIKNNDKKAMITTNQFKPYNPTENFGSCGIPSQTIQTSTQITQSNEMGKASLKVYVALWCGWSKRLLQQLESDEFKNKFNDIKNICVLEIIDCEKDKGKCDNSIVKGFPTIILQTKDGKMISYNGDRSTDDLIKFIKANN